MKLKLSWHHFLIVILAVIILGSLVYYLEQNKIIEGYDQPIDVKLTEKQAKDIEEIGKKVSRKDSNNNSSNSKLMSETTSSNFQTGGDTDNNESSDVSDNEGVTEGFSNLSWGNLNSENSENSDCMDSLIPFKNNKCGPVSVNNFFRDIQFKPECCGNSGGSSYSNSMGCACLCPDQITFLNSRGGNRTFPTEF